MRTGRPGDRGLFVPVWEARRAAIGPVVRVASATLASTMMASRHNVDASLTVRALMRHPMGSLPVAMSLGALAMIVWFVAVHGVAHQPDEGAQAHLWQLLVAGQVPLMAYCAFRWLPRARRPALLDLALQAAAIMLVAVAPLWALGGL
jgi:hypothetical protein